MKTKYKATLASGEVFTRTSERVYTHYWECVATRKTGTPGMRVVPGGGFAGSEGLARNAARGFETRFTKPPGMYTVTTEIVPVEIVKKPEKLTFRPVKKRVRAEYAHEGEWDNGEDQSQGDVLGVDDEREQP